MTLKPIALFPLLILLAGCVVTIRPSKPRDRIAAPRHHTVQEAPERSGERREIERVLDQLHRSASEADGERYFALFAPGAIFFGTDATERWTVDEFRAYAEPYFSQGQGWTYEVLERHVFLGGAGATAWFDERLWNEKYGECRGTGALELIAGTWRIAQYNLTFPVPNEVSGEVTEIIRRHLEGGAGGD